MVDIKHEKSIGSCEKWRNGLKPCAVNPLNTFIKYGGPLAAVGETPVGPLRALQNPEDQSWKI